MARTPVYLILTHNAETDIHEYFRVPVHIVTEKELAWIEKFKGQHPQATTVYGFHNSMISILNNGDVSSLTYHAINYNNGRQHWSVYCRHQLKADSVVMDPELHDVRGIYVLFFSEE